MATASPRISIVMGSRRPGGLDVSFAGLPRQTLRDFEFIFVDYLYEWRKAEVRAYAEQLGIAIIHIPPREQSANIMQTGMMLNTGLMHAQGELVCFIGDYTYMPPTWLDDHWRVYSNSGKGATLNGCCTKHHPPALKASFDSRILENGQSALQDDCKISAFAEPFDPSFFDTSPVTWTGRGTPHWSSFLLTQNQSLPMALLLKINGLDEGYDSNNIAWQDNDTGLRAVLAGHSLQPDSSAAWLREIDHRMMWGGFSLPEEVTRARLGERQRLGTYWAENNGFNLEEARCRTLG